MHDVNDMASTSHEVCGTVNGTDVGCERVGVLDKGSGTTEFGYIFFYLVETELDGFGFVTARPAGWPRTDAIVEIACGAA